MPKPLYLLILLFPFIAVADVPSFTEDGYKVPQPEGTLEFPADHASHPGYKIEWWYLTGHLHAADGRRFGYQATFFRSALKAPKEQETSPFGSSQLYLTHMALTDENGKVFYHDQRLAREGWDAYAKTSRLEVRNGSWMLKSVDPSVTKMQLHAGASSDVLWDLELSPAKPLIRFGEDGTSRKGPAPEARSYYLSFTRLKTTGTVTMAGETIAVSGTSWMDHEIASNQLDASLTGWDWIAIQLEDGWDVKAYLLRKEDGTPSEFSALIWIDPKGNVTYRDRNEFTWEKPDRWNSPETEAAYPINPVITTPHPLTNKPVTFRFDPLLENQELVFPGTTYWEGAGRIYDGEGNETGSAYLELVGYAGAIEGLR